MMFTPGPWSLKPDLLGAPVVQTAEREVAKVLYHLGSEDRDVTYNARLIAAAPDMYEALKAACLGCEERDNVNECDGGECCVYQALSKAEGREQ